jgi:hypothetical protein
MGLKIESVLMIDVIISQYATTLPGSHLCNVLNLVHPQLQAQSRKNFEPGTSGVQA